MDRRPLDAALEETARELAALHKRHYDARSSLQRAVETLTQCVAHPCFAIAVAALACVWVAVVVYSALVPSTHLGASPPWLQVALGFAALLMTSMILTGQRKNDDLGEERAEMTLYLLAVLDRKLSSDTPAAPTDVAHAKDVLDRAHEEQFGRSESAEE